MEQEGGDPFISHAEGERRARRCQGPKIRGRQNQNNESVGPEKEMQGHIGGKEKYEVYE